MINLNPVYPDLKGKVAVVTGAGSGIGRAVAKELARQNMYIAILDIHEGGLQETFNEILLELGNSRDYKLAAYFLCDVANEKQVAKTFAEIVKLTHTIDTVVNNAGIVPKESLAMADVTIELWDKIMAVNTTGYFLVTKYAEQAFIKQAKMSQDGKYESGSLVYVCSNAGILGSAKNIYGISNAARINMMRQAALEMAPYGIRANAVIPGDVLEGSGIWDKAYLGQRAEAKNMSVEEAKKYYETRAPLGKKATAEQVAKMVCFLASLYNSGNTTGQILRCDGGQLMT